MSTKKLKKKKKNPTRFQLVTNVALFFYLNCKIIKTLSDLMDKIFNT